MKLCRVVAILMFGAVLVVTSKDKTINCNETVLINDRITAGISSRLYDIVDGIDMSTIEHNDTVIVESSYYDEEHIVDGAQFEKPVENELGYNILYACTRVNLRSEPNDTSDILGVLDIGDKIKIYGNIGNDIWSWTEDSDGNRIYICNAYLCLEDPANSYTEEELELMAHLIMGEGGNTSELCQMYIGSVVLNRVNSDKFPDTINDVIYQKHQYQCTWDGNFNKKPTEMCYSVAEKLLKYGSVLSGSYLGQADKSIANRYGNKDTFIVVDGEYFFEIK